jgi:hypothetical protein
MSHHSDFLLRAAPSHGRRKNRRRLLTGVFSVGVFLVGALAIWTAVNVGLLVTALLDGRDQLLAAKAAVETFSFSQARLSLDAATVDFSKANQRLRAVGWFKIVPWLGPQVTAAEALLKASTDLFPIVNEVGVLGAEVVRLTGESETAGQAAGEFLPLRYDEMSPATKRIVLQRINGAAPDLALAAEQAGLIKEDLSDLGDLPGPMGGVVRKIEDTLSQIYNSLSLAATAARIIPAFTGLGEEKNFLLLLENNTELRPGGGFIGTYGILKIEDGEIRELELSDSYLLDAAADPYYSLEPPGPLKKYLSTNEWYFRDSNWSPDFSVSARNAISIFTNEVLSIPAATRSAVQEPLSFDGVIALTPTSIADLLKIFGPITIGNQTFSADNITETLEYQVEVGFRESGTPYSQRKEIVAALLNEMKAALFDLPFFEWGPIASAVVKNLAEKQIVLFSNSSFEAEEVIRQAGWGGVVEKGDGDFVMVVDANMAALKTDPRVSREISYTLEPSDDGRLIGKVVIHYDHRGDFDWKTTRYRTYTRVYVPLGSELIGGTGMMADDKIKNPSGAPGAIEVGQELGLTVFGAFISIEPGESGDLSFEYYLPDSLQKKIEVGDYSLRVAKQLGAADHGLTLDLDFDKKVTGAEPSEERIDWGDQVYKLKTSLESDKEFLVRF